MSTRWFVFICYSILIFLMYLSLTLSNDTIPEWPGLINTAGIWLLTYRVWLVPIMAVLTAFLPKPKYVIQPTDYIKATRRRILEGIKSEAFDNELGDVRITLFVEAGPIRNTLLHIKMWVVQTYRWDEYSQRGSFLVIDERISIEDNRASWSTSFYCHHTSPEACNGIAAYVRRSTETVEVDGLPDITDINLDEVDIRSDSEKARRLRKYMESTKVDRIADLKSINRKASHFYGIALFNREGKSVGALVVDSMEDFSFLDEETKGVLVNHAKALSYTYQTE